MGPRPQQQQASQLGQDNCRIKWSVQSLRCDSIAYQLNAGNKWWEGSTEDPACNGYLTTESGSPPDKLLPSIVLLARLTGFYEPRSSSRIAQIKYP